MEGRVCGCESVLLFLCKCESKCGGSECAMCTCEHVDVGVHTCKRKCV